MSDVAGAVDATQSGGAAAGQTQDLLGGSAPKAPVGSGEPSSVASNVAPPNGASAAAGGQSQDAVAKTQAQQDLDWRHRMAQGLPEADRDAFINEAARAPTEADFAKRFLDLRRTSSKAILIPAEDDPERESKLGDIYSKMGRPEGPDKYQLNWDGPEPLSESETAAFDEFRQVHFRNGGNQKQLDDMVKWESQQRRVQTEAWRAKAEDTENQNMATLKGVWGSDFDQNKAVYGTTVRHYMGSDTEAFAEMRMADGTRVANNPIIARAFAKVGRERATDDFDYTPMNADRKAGAEEKLKTLQSEMISKGIRPGMPGYPQEEFDRLHAQVGATRKRSPNDRFARTA